MQRKPYLVGHVSTTPNLDSMPVAKITDYPLEKRDYKPFAQAVLCMGTDAFFLRMWAFEVSPPAGSALECVFYPYPDSPDLAFGLHIVHGEDHASYSAFLCKNGHPPELIAPHALEGFPHNGEDLQGVYWGMRLTLPFSVLEQAGGRISLAEGNILPGNFYKICSEGTFMHKGSLFRVSWKQPYARESMGEFRIVGY